MTAISIENIIFDTEALFAFKEGTRPSRVFFNASRQTPEMPATALTSLHIKARGDVEVRLWKKNAVQVSAPDRTYPYKIHADKNKIVITEENGQNTKGRLIIRAPRRIDFLNVILFGQGACDSDIVPQFACVTTKDMAVANIYGEHLMGQCLGSSHLFAALIPQRFHKSTDMRRGNVLVLHDGKEVLLNGMYERSEVLFTNDGRELVHSAKAEEIKCYSIRPDGDMRTSSPRLRLTSPVLSINKISGYTANTAPEAAHNIISGFANSTILKLGIRP